MNAPSLASAYNQMAHLYLRERHLLRSQKYLTKLIKLLPKNASILDLGCGAGTPVDDFLIAKNYLVTGLDISPTQIALARQYCPRGSFHVQDIQDLQPREYQADAVISFYALFHLPRQRHLEILQKIRSFLPVGGFCLLTMGDRDLEGEFPLYGSKVFYSQFATEKNLKLMQEAGFKIVWNEIDTSGQERHQVSLLTTYTPPGYI